MSPTGIPTSTGLSALRQGADRPLGGFHGCIREVRINNELQDFKALPPQALGVSPGCKSCTVCRHGLCRPVEKDSVVCECHPGWTGPLCDQEAQDPCLSHRSVSRDGSWGDCGQAVDRACGRVSAETRRRPARGRPCVPRTRPCRLEKGPGRPLGRWHEGDFGPTEPPSACVGSRCVYLGTTEPHVMAYSWQIFIEGLLCAWPCGKQERPSSSVLTPEPRLELGGCRAGRWHFRSGTGDSSSEPWLSLSSR